MRLLVCVLALLLGLGAAWAAEPVPTPKMIFFATGSTRGTVGGHVLRGARDLYSLKGLAGQIMTVTITDKPRWKPALSSIQGSVRLRPIEKNR